MIKQLVVFGGALVRDKKILLSLRTEEKLTGAHLKWEYPGGKVEFGETPQGAVKREFFEETGIDVLVKKMLPVCISTNWEYDWGIQQTFGFVFLCEYISESKRQIDHHVADVQWFTLEEARKLDALPGHLEILQEIEHLLT